MSGRDADCPKPLKEWVIQSIEVRRIGTLLPIARPGVDQDRSAAFLNEPTVNAQQDVLPGLIHSFGWQPVRMIRENTCIPIRKQRRRRNICQRQFSDVRDRGLADRVRILFMRVAVHCSRFGVRVRSSGFEVWGLGFGVWGSASVLICEICGSIVMQTNSNTTRCDPQAL